MEPLISVIIPVYKCEEYLEKCVNSVFLQTYSNLEVILVDDGSPDCCPQICDELAKRDGRVKVFHKINGGASSARNVGIDNAAGNYICFVDSDDILPKNAIFDLWQELSNNDCQYAAGICGILNRNKTKNNITTEKIIDYQENPEDLLNYITQSGSYSPYSKIYDAEIIKSNNLRYNERLECSEDALFIRQYLFYCHRIVLIPKIVYQYNTDNDNSLSKKFYPEFCFYYSKKIEALEKLVEKLSIPERTKKDFIFDRAVHGLYISIRHYMTNCSDEEQSICLIEEAITILKKWIDIDGKNTSHKKWWSQNMNFIKKCDAKKIYIISKKTIKKEKTIYMLKQFLKKRIKGTNR